ncbi:MAG: TIGR02646 family protein [Okeania sp. SIO2H7]|nr:TIGR02646 family protein [Okeania sp. SIO2H7]
MKYIKKSNEPEELANFKAAANENWQPTFREFRGEDKRKLQQKLIEEQGNICCYCGMRITREDSHIEHLKPQSKYPEDELNYNNLLASCQLKREPKQPQHCGVKKDDWYDEDLMVSPLEPNCGDFFRYTKEGEILPTDEEDKKIAAATTIKKLELNIDRLQAMRLEAIEGILTDIDKLSKSKIEELANGFEKQDDRGKYEPFCQAVVYVLRKYYLPPQ